MAGSTETGMCYPTAIPGILPAWPAGGIKEKAATSAGQFLWQTESAHAGMNIKKTGESQRSDAASCFDDAGFSDFGALYEKFKRPIHSYIYRLLGSREDADDITQEVFTRAYAAWNDLYDRENLSPWLYRIATNLSVDLLRRRKRISWWPLSRSRWGDDAGNNRQDEEAFYLPPDSGGIPEVGEREHIQKTLARMPHEYAVALVLSAAQGIPYQEIAVIVGISPNAAATRISRAKRIFAELYRRAGEEGVGTQEQER
jgi:RNA polymerase sigma-70 factor, ECF subfamily